MCTTHAHVHCVCTSIYTDTYILRCTATSCELALVNTLTPSTVYYVGGETWREGGREGEGEGGREREREGGREGGGRVKTFK